MVAILIIISIMLLIALALIYIMNEVNKDLQWEVNSLDLTVQKLNSKLEFVRRKNLELKHKEWILKKK